MGFRVHLIVVSGKGPEDVCRDYGVAPSGRREEIPESPVVGAALPGGGYLLYVNDGTAPDDRVYARLSRNASLIACNVNETVMTSSACAWANGVERWSVSHDAQRGLHHLETTGVPPEELRPIRDRLLAEQAGGGDADFIFDIPVELFAALGGIRYDQDIPGAGPEPWEVLDRRGRAARSA